MGGVNSKPDPSRFKTIEVIGAGMARTGTMSMQLALERIMEGPVNHGGKNFMTGTEENNRIWTSVLHAKLAGEKELLMKLLRERLTGYIGFCDWPAGFCIPELLEMYPEAKFVLVLRDQDKWWKSFEEVVKTPLSLLPRVLSQISPGIRWIGQFTEGLQDCSSMNQEAYGYPREWGPHSLEAHNTLVLDLVPKERLLVMKLGEGWEPICKFLGKPVPDEPFPHANEAAALEEMVQGLLRKLAFMWLGAFAALGGTVAIGYTLWKRLG
ncbi:hypothetical protein VTL71DRAFT_13856 [Oculimacula yallundae]|uniref:Uncharacterized protein n=1 Tax=Oculimacula yallundae TaxID=86028 RepID=A0ABR4CLL9_9HELO